MPLQKGLAPFIFTAVLIVFGLLIEWVCSSRMEPSRANIFARIGNTLALMGVIFGFQFRLSEWLYGESYFGRTDSLPGPVVIVLMFGLYVSLRILLVNYTQYRKNHVDGEFANQLIKEAFGSFVVLIVLIILAIIMESLRF